MSVHVVVVTIGSRGDVQPCVALVVGLRNAGVSVSLAAPTAFAGLAAAHGVEFRGLPVDPAGMLAAELGQVWIESGRDVRAFLRGLRDLADPFGESVADAILAACDDAELIVYATLAFPAWHVAQARGVPAVQFSFAPLCPTAAFPPVLFPDPFAGCDPWQATPRGAVIRSYHRAAHRLFAQALWLPLRRRVNRWRRTRLGLPPAGWRSPGLEVDVRGEPLLQAFSPTILPPPRDWGPHVTTTGAWFLDTPDGWRPPRDLAGFLDAGSPPVVVGMGSMTSREPAALTAVVVDALRRTGHRGVLVTGWGGLGRGGDLGDDVLVSEGVPYDWLLPRAAAVVHHGGAGTTAAGLRAGVPTVVVPHFGDQPLWGDRVRALGAGPPPLPRADLTADRLVAALRAATGDPGIRTAAAAAGRAIRGERGVARAVEVITAIATATAPRSDPAG
jgi:UDP:flavonoid glycosyltransferase YjiC (YdhE family)